MVKLNRKSKYWRLYIIIPSILFVLIAYSSFYISRAAAPARWVYLPLYAILAAVTLNVDG